MQLATKTKTKADHWVDMVDLESFDNDKKNGIHFDYNFNSDKEETVKV